MYTLQEMTNDDSWMTLSGFNPPPRDSDQVSMISMSIDQEERERMGISPFVNRKRPLDDERPGPSKRTTEEKPGPSGEQDGNTRQVKEEPMEDDVTILDSFEARPQYDGYQR